MQAAESKHFFDHVIKILPIIHSMIPNVGIGITNREEWLAYFPGKKVNLGVKAGTKINPSEPLADCIRNNKWIKEEVPAEFFGFTFTGFAAPIFYENEVIGAVAIQFQEQDERNLRRISDQMVTSITQANESITEIAAGAEGLTGISHTLLEESKRASVEMNQTEEVITFIKRIADQTNLLGLNASIEAARAGDMGRGFGIVANEIRKLSNETVSSTEKIRTMLTQFQKTMNEMTTLIEKVYTVGQSQAASTQEIAAFIEEIQSMSKELNEYAAKL